MTTTTFDTSGSVPMPSAHGGTVPVRWGGLDPFTQGYIEALFESPTAPHAGEPLRFWHGFSDLAPEALARIMEECRAHQRDAHRSGFTGRQWWAYQAKRGLTPYLGDDGKIHLRESA